MEEIRKLKQKNKTLHPKFRFLFLYENLEFNL